MNREQTQETPINHTREMQRIVAYIEGFSDGHNGFSDRLNKALERLEKLK